MVHCGAIGLGKSHDLHVLHPGSCERPGTVTARRRRMKSPGRRCGAPCQTRVLRFEPYAEKSCARGAAMAPALRQCDFRLRRRHRSLPCCSRCVPPSAVLVLRKKARRAREEEVVVGTTKARPSRGSPFCRLDVLAHISLPSHTAQHSSTDDHS